MENIPKIAEYFIWFAIAFDILIVLGIIMYGIWNLVDERTWTGKQ